MSTLFAAAALFWFEITGWLVLAWFLAGGMAVMAIGISAVNVLALLNPERAVQRSWRRQAATRLLQPPPPKEPVPSEPIEQLPTHY